MAGGLGVDAEPDVHARNALLSLIPLPDVHGSTQINEAVRVITAKFRGITDMYALGLNMIRVDWCQGAAYTEREQAAAHLLRGLYVETLQRIEALLDFPTPTANTAPGNKMVTLSDPTFLANVA